jgi:hypothetical protein
MSRGGNSGKFCSHKCFSDNRKNKPLPENKGDSHKSIKRICLTCGKEFEAWPSRIKNGGGKYCSYKCSQSKKVSLEKRICLTCGKQFEEYPSIHGRYCSRRCYAKARQIQKPSSICPTCGEEFDYSQNKKYCSPECNPHNKSGKFSKKKMICIQCNKEFFGLSDRKTCSHKCAGEYRSKQYVGENNPNYSGGHNAYCEKWTKKFKQRIIAFFGNTCIECGEIPSKTLRCHHVYYDKKACCAINEDGKYFSNLNIKGREHNFEIIGDPNKFVPLCERCHNKTHGKNKREFYARHFEEIINTQYNGKSYYTKEEYELLQSSPQGALK